MLLHPDPRIIHSPPPVKVDEGPLPDVQADRFRRLIAIVAFSQSPLAVRQRRWREGRRCSSDLVKQYLSLWFRWINICLRYDITVKLGSHAIPSSLEHGPMVVVVGAGNDDRANDNPGG